jgi:hypothetical protein
MRRTEGYYGSIAWVGSNAGGRFWQNSVKPMLLAEFYEFLGY